MAEGAAQEECRGAVRDPVASPTSPTAAIAPAIIESCPQRIFLPNDRAIEPQARAAYERFGLNERQIELIAARHAQAALLPAVARAATGCSSSASGRSRSRFCGASDPASQARIDAILAEHGADGFAARFLDARRPRLGRRPARRFSDDSHPAKEKHAMTKLLIAAPARVAALVADRRRRRSVPARRPQRDHGVRSHQLRAEPPARRRARSQQINNQIQSLQNEAHDAPATWRGTSSGIDFPELAAAQPDARSRSTG